MEAAIAAAERGEIVTLVDKSDSLGGQVRLASSIEARTELGTIIDHQIAELDRLGVEVQLGRAVDAAAVAELQPDVVIVATGSQPRPDPIPSDGSIEVLAPIDVMANPKSFSGKRVVVVDEVAHFQAYAPAEALVDAGATVSILSPKLYLCSLLDQATMTTTLRRLAGKEVGMVPNSLVLEISDGSLRVRDTLSGVERTVQADAVVAAVGNRAVDELANAIAVADPTVPRARHRRRSCATDHPRGRARRSHRRPLITGDPLTLLVSS